MTLDDLVKIADKAEAEIEWVLKEGDGQRAGIRAVVQALRDDACRDCRAQLDKILGDAATDACPRCGHPAQDQCDSPDCNMAAACFVCGGAGVIYTRTMHDPDGPREKEVCEECHAVANE